MSGIISSLSDRELIAIAEKHQNFSGTPKESVTTLGSSLGISRWSRGEFLGELQCLPAMKSREEYTIISRYLDAVEKILGQECVTDINDQLPDHFHGNRGAMRGIVPHVPVIGSQTQDTILELISESEGLANQGKSFNLVTLLEGKLGCHFGIENIAYEGAMELPGGFPIYSVGNGGIYTVHLFGFPTFNQGETCECCGYPAVGILPLHQFYPPLIS